LPSEYVEICSESEMVLFKPSERLPSHKIPYCHSELYSDGLSFITRIHLSDIQIAKRMLQEAKKLSFQPSLFEREIAPMYSIEYAEIIWEELEGYIPIIMSSEETWIPYYINPRFRIIRYNKNQSSHKHTDGPYISNDERSFFSVVLYLTTSTDGLTVFYSLNDPEIVIHNEPPEKGKLVIFPHHMSHATSPLSSTKYVARTDIIYKKKSTNYKFNSTHQYVLSFDQLALKIN